jgi:hypothetical protein
MDGCRRGATACASAGDKGTDCSFFGRSWHRSTTKAPAAELSEHNEVVDHHLALALSAGVALADPLPQPMPLPPVWPDRLDAWRGNCPVGWRSVGDYCFLPDVRIRLRKRYMKFASR